MLCHGTAARHRRGARHRVAQVFGQRDQEGDDRGANGNRKGHLGQRSGGSGKRGRKKQAKMGVGS